MNQNDEPESLDSTFFFKDTGNVDLSMKEVLGEVYLALAEKGFDPLSQLTGYLVTRDKTYITVNNDARSLITKYDYDDYLEDLVKEHLASETDSEDVIRCAYDAAIAKKYTENQAVGKIVGYFVTEDPTYLVAYHDARHKMTQCERDVLIYGLLKEYLREYEEEWQRREAAARERRILEERDKERRVKEEEERQRKIKQQEAEATEDKRKQLEAEKAEKKRQLEKKRRLDITTEIYAILGAAGLLAALYVVRWAAMERNFGFGLLFSQLLGFCAIAMAVTAGGFTLSMFLGSFSRTLGILGMPAGAVAGFLLCLQQRKPGALHKTAIAVAVIIVVMIIKAVIKKMRD